MIDSNIFKKVSIFVVLAALIILAGMMLWPIGTAIVTGLLLAYVFFPVFTRVKKMVKEKNIAAIIVILLVLFLIFLPLWFLLPLIVKQVFDIYLQLQKIDLFSLLQTVMPYLTEVEFSKDFVISFNSFIAEMASRFFSSTSSLILDIPNLALKGAVVLFVFFFAMRDASLFKSYIASLSPFSKTTEKDFTKKFKDITYSVIFGFVIVGVIQGILTGIGLFVFQVPRALLLTIIAIFASIIPILGSWVVWLPAAVYLLLQGHVFLAIGLGLYGGLIVGWVDNIIRPYIVASKTQISTAIVLVGMIGGLLVFGILGLIIGPLIFSYLLLVLDAYRNKNFAGLFS